MSSLRAVLRDEAVYDYSLSEIVSKYLDWVRDDKYMILNRVQFKDFRIRDSRENRFISYRLPIKSDYIKTKHNSNHKTQQTTLKGEIVKEYTYYVLGFVPAYVLKLKNKVWFSKLNTEQASIVEKFLEMRA